MPEQDVHAKVAMIVEREGFVAAKREFREAKKVQNELGQSIDKTSQRLEQFDRLQKKGLLTQKEATQARRRAIVSDVAGQVSLPFGLSRAATGGIAGILAAATSLGGVVTQQVVQEHLRLMREIAENTRAAQALGIDPKERERIVGRLRTAGPGGRGGALTDEQSNALADSLIRAGQEMGGIGGEQVFGMVRSQLRGMPTATGVQRQARRELVRSFGLPMSMLAVADEGLGPVPIVPSDTSMPSQDFMNEQELRFEQNRMRNRFDTPGSGTFGGSRFGARGTADRIMESGAVRVESEDPPGDIVNPSP